MLVGLDRAAGRRRRAQIAARAGRRLSAEIQGFVASVERITAPRRHGGCERRIARLPQLVRAPDAQL